MNKRKRPPQKKGRSPNLLDHVIQLTGIPSDMVKRELKHILETKGIDGKKLTLEQLRSVVASYLREIMSGVLIRTPLKRTRD